MNAFGSLHHVRTYVVSFSTSRRHRDIQYSCVWWSDGENYRFSLFIFFLLIWFLGFFFSVRKNNSNAFKQKYWKIMSNMYKILAITFLASGGHPTGCVTADNIRPENNVEKWSMYMFWMDSNRSGLTLILCAFYCWLGMQKSSQLEGGQAAPMHTFFT